MFNIGDTVRIVLDNPNTPLDRVINGQLGTIVTFDPNEYPALDDSFFCAVQLSGGVIIVVKEHEIEKVI